MDIKTIREKVTIWIGKYKFIALILLIGIGLMLIPGTKKEESPVVETTMAQETSLGEELEQILCNIKGAGRVQVMLTVESGQQVIYQTDASSADKLNTVIITGQDRAQEGLIQQILSPTYRGAIILCQGADSASVCLSIKEAVSKVTGLDSSQISILKMK